MKHIEELSERELLAELLREQKKSNLYGRIYMALSAAALALVLGLALLFMPKAFTTLNNIDELVGDTNTVIEQAQKSIGKIDLMVENVNDLVEENTEAVSDTIENISQIDIDSLNRSIQQLDDVIEPLSRFFNVFNR